MSGTIIGIANAFGSSLSPGVSGQGQSPGPTPGADPMNFYVTPYNSGGTSTPSGQYKLGLYSTGTYNFTVNWGDGSADDVITTWNQAEATHDYGVVTPADRFEITITANTAFASSSFDHWYFGNRTQGDGIKVSSIGLYGGVRFYANEDVFYGCEVLTTASTSLSNIPTFVNKNIIDSFFFKCTNLSASFTTNYWVGPFTGTAIDFNGGTQAGLVPTGSSNAQFGFDFAPTSLLRAFKNQAQFNNSLLNTWDVSGSNNFSECFEACLRFNSPLPWTFQTGAPVFASDMFKNAVDFNQDISAWNTSAFTKMDGMFARTLPIGGVVTSSTFNQPISSWNTNAVEDAQAMFFNAEAFNRDLTNWFSTGALVNVSFSAGGIISMFSGATLFNGFVDNWDTSNLLSFAFVFNGASSFNRSLSTWDTSSSLVFVSTFKNATSFNQDLSSWDVSSGFQFDEMFQGATSFLGTGIDTWNTSSATSFNSMFNGASVFNQNLATWDIGNLTSAVDMLTGTAISTENWDNLLLGWGYSQQANLPNNVTLSQIPVPHSAGFPNAVYEKLTDSVASGGYGWTIGDGGSQLPPPALEFTIDTANVEAGSSASNQYSLPLMSTGTYNFYVNWGDGTIGDQITSWNQTEATHTYATSGTYTIQILATSLSSGTAGSLDHISWASQDGTTLSAANDRLKVQDISKWGSAIIYLNEYVFTNCENLNITTTSSPTFGSKVLRTSVFENCDNLSGDLSGWGTVASPITGQAGLFYKNSASSNPNFNFVLQHNSASLIQAFNNSTGFNNPLNNWDVSSSSGFTSSFSGASAFNQDISGWDTGGASAFNAMFFNALAFNQNISGWNVANVTTFSQMFQGATLFNQPVGAWTTTSLTNLFSTFNNATAFNQDLANWDVSGVTTASNMLTNSGINAVNWDKLLIGWAAQGTGAGSLQTNVTLSNINQLHGSVNSAATAAYNKLTSAPYNWNIVDLGAAPVGNLLLDTSYGTGAEAAYSVRKLRTSYTGPAMKVQDTVGGTTQDIYFDANNNLDEAAIISYGGSNDVFVETWYDQSGNGNNATQGTSSRRPKIYDGTTGAITKSNGRVIVSFENGNSLTSTAWMSAVSPLSFTCVYGHKSNAARAVIIGVDTAIPYDPSLRVWNDGGGKVLMHNLPATTNWITPFVSGNRYLISGYASTTSASYYKNGNPWPTNPTAHTNTTAIADAITIGSPTTYNPGSFETSEIIAWLSDKSGTDQTSIEENIGDYFTQNTPLLDTYSGAAAAYSLRLLDSTYTGFAIKVQDNVGGATQDIGFNVFGELDTTSLARYGGSNDVFVTAWYDQSGNGNNATQTSSVLRPKIYDGTTGTVVDNNGKPTLSFINDKVTLTNELFLRSNAPDAFLISLVAEGTEGTSDGEYFGGSTFGSTNFFANYGSTSNYRFRHTNDANTGNINTTFAYPSPAPVVGEMSLLNLYIESSTKKMQLNGQQLTASGNTVWSSTSNYKFNLGIIGRPYAEELNLQVSEFVVWPNQSSTDLSEIQSNINTFYDIYTEPVAPLLLNEYPGAKAAYSLRKINSSYQGSAVLVQTALNTKGPG